MKLYKLHISRSLALTVLLGCTTGGALVIDSAIPQQAVAQDVDEAYFYSNLAPHGEWFFQGELGWVWHPARVGPGWRPYTEGQWVWAEDVGWTWASDEPWGWATYHYGRWYFDPIYGWSWVPGRTWAPAWVNWRVEAGYIGWAPLWPAYFDIHPEYRWDSWGHDHDWDNRHRGRDWDRWVFTRDRDFTSDRVGQHQIRDRRERDSIYSRSRDVTQYDESRPERIGHSIDRTVVEKATGRPVRAVRLEAADQPGTRVEASGDRVRMFRPKVRETPDKTPDRLGLAKEPAPEARQTNTLRQEKARLDRVPEDQKTPSRHGRAADEKGRAAGEKGDRAPAVEPASETDRQADRPDKAGANERGRRNAEGAGVNGAQPDGRERNADRRQPNAGRMAPNAGRVQPDSVEQPDEIQTDRAERPDRTKPQQGRPDHMNADRGQPQKERRQQPGEPQRQPQREQPQMQQERMQHQQGPQGHREERPEPASQREREPGQQGGNPGGPDGGGKPQHGGNPGGPDGGGRPQHGGGHQGPPQDNPNQQPPPRGNKH